MDPSLVDSLVVVVPAALVVAVIGLVGYRVKKRADHRTRVESAHRGPDDQPGGGRTPS